MNRRTLIAGLGSAAAWPVVARAQQAAMPVVGVLNSGSSDYSAPFMAGFREGLRQLGYIEGQNVAVQYRWADGQYDKLPALVADLVSRKVTVILAGAPPAAQAAKAATSTIPIVFTSGGDAVKLGLVSSLGRPEGNITGVSFLIDELNPKRFGLLRDLVPQARTIGFLVNPLFMTPEQLRGVEEAAGAAGVQFHIFDVGTERDFQPAFARMVELRVDGLLVNGDPFFTTRIEQIVGLAARYSIPAIYNQREFVSAGGLMSYDTSIPGAYRLAGMYVGRILRGVHPADLPVMQPEKFEFIINLKTAKVLGLAIPPGLMAIADEVIE